MRLLTRSDFDGLMCTVLLKELDLFDEKILLVRDGHEAGFTVIMR